MMFLELAEIVQTGATIYKAKDPVAMKDEQPVVTGEDALDMLGTEYGLVCPLEVEQRIRKGHLGIQVEGETYSHWRWSRGQSVIYL